MKLFEYKNLLSAILFLEKAKGKKQIVFLIFIVLLITLIQCCEINREYSNNLIDNFTIYGTLIINMLYCFVLVSDAICIREKKSGRIEWFLANGVSPSNIVDLMTISELIVVVLVESIYLVIVILLIILGIISRNFLNSSTALLLFIINLVFYHFVDLMNIIFLVVKKPENIKLALLVCFTCMFFVVYIPVYIIYIYNISNISNICILGLMLGVVILLSVIQKLKKRILNNKFKEKVTLSFKD